MLRMSPGVRVSIGLILLLILLVGCSAAEKAEGAGQAVEQLRSRVSELEAQVRTLREELASVEARSGQLEQQLILVKKELYGRFEHDSRGETPDRVMTRYLEATRAKDWVKAFRCLGSVPDEISLELYVREMERADDELLEYSVNGYELLDPEHAIVYVTHRFRYTSNGQVLSFEREPWSCVKEKGVWKVRWLPRQ
ncbi:MAG: hypothetical protein ACPLPR_01105 [Bacillota bacterium]